MSARDDKIKFLKLLLPKPLYSFSELAALFHCSKSTIEYWIEKHEVPTIKITGAPRILQGNLINMFLTADKKNKDEDKLCGLEFVIEDMKKCQL